MFCTGFHRRKVVTLAAALTVVVGAMAYDQARAAPTEIARVEIAATALKPAVRLTQSGMIMFPMNPVPKCSLSKTSFGQPRSGGRTHEGIDLMASLGQEIYAVNNGTLTKQTIDGTPDATLSGNAWHLQLIGWHRDLLLLRSPLGVRCGVEAGRHGDQGPTDRLCGRHRRPRPGELPPALRGASEGRRRGGSISVVDDPQDLHGRALNGSAAN